MTDIKKETKNTFDVRREDDFKKELENEIRIAVAERMTDYVLCQFTNILIDFEQDVLMLDNMVASELAFRRFERVLILAVIFQKNCIDDYIIAITRLPVAKLQQDIKERLDDEPNEELYSLLTHIKIQANTYDITWLNSNSKTLDETYSAKLYTYFKRIVTLETELDKLRDTKKRLD